MKEPLDLRELVGSDLPPEELEELSRVDAHAAKRPGAAS